MLTFNEPTFSELPSLLLGVLWDFAVFLWIVRIPASLKPTFEILEWRLLHLVGVVGLRVLQLSLRLLKVLFLVRWQLEVLRFIQVPYGIFEEIEGPLLGLDVVVDFIPQFLRNRNSTPWHIEILFMNQNLLLLFKLEDGSVLDERWIFREWFESLISLGTKASRLAWSRWVGSRCIRWARRIENVLSWVEVESFPIGQHIEDVCTNQVFLNCKYLELLFWRVLSLLRNETLSQVGDVLRQWLDLLNLMEVSLFKEVDVLVE